MKKKILLAIAHGLGDRPCEVLGYKTPLEVAHKPHLNQIAAQGSTGIMDLHQCGTPVGTDLGHMILFGYELADYPGRGPIETFGFTGACVAAESTVLGAAKLAGFDTITDPRMTGNVDTDIELKARLAIDALKTHDFVCLHLKATDLMGHDNKPEGKKEAVELFDKMMSHVLEMLPEITDADVVLAMAADHSTPCERREHSGEPVPVVISGRTLRKDEVEEYDEMYAAKGALNRMTGRMFNRLLLDYLEVSPKRGN